MFVCRTKLRATVDTTVELWKSNPPAGPNGFRSIFTFAPPKTGNGKGPRATAKSMAEAPGWFQAFRFEYCVRHSLDDSDTSSSIRLALFFLLLLLSKAAWPQQAWSTRLADSAIAHWPDGHMTRGQEKLSDWAYDIKCAAGRTAGIIRSNVGSEIHGLCSPICGSAGQLARPDSVR